MRNYFSIFYLTLKKNKKSTFEFLNFSRLAFFALAFLFLSFSLQKVSAETANYTEDFSTANYEDIGGTSATWDTVAHKVSIPAGLDAAVTQSTMINVADFNISTATLTAMQTLNGETVAYALSNDGGYTWQDVALGTPVIFMQEGSNLLWRASLATDDIAKIPEINSLAIQYTLSESKKPTGAILRADYSDPNNAHLVNFTFTTEDTNAGGGTSGPTPSGVASYQLSNDGTTWTNEIVLSQPYINDTEITYNSWDMRSYGGNNDSQVIYIRLKDNDGNQSQSTYDLSYNQTKFDTVIGQDSMDDTGRITSQYNTSSPEGVFSYGNKLFVADAVNQRVLIWNSIPTTNDKPADVVIGQTNFKKRLDNCAVPSSTTLCDPASVYFDGAKLYISDAGNNRILIYNTFPTHNGAAADVVIGQSNFTDKAAVTSQTGLSNPRGLRKYGSKLVLADAGNSRVLIWNSVPITNNAPADLILGQDSWDALSYAVGPGSFSSPNDVEVIGNKLAIADKDGGRVLIWDSFPAANNVPADQFLGQPDGNTVGWWFGPASNSLQGPTTLATDGTNLFVATQESRVLIFSSLITNANADSVIGQSALDQSAPALSQDGLSSPYGVAYGSGKIFVSDSGNNRVLVWNTAPSANGALADIVVGQPNFISNSGSNPYKIREGYGNAVVTYKGKLYISDYAQNRIMVYNRPPTTNGAPADFVIGQPNLFADNTGSPVPEVNNVQGPYGIAINNDKLFIASYFQARVMIWNSLPTTSGALPDVVVGKPNFTAILDYNDNPANASNIGRTCGVGVYSNKLVVCDSDHGRILIWNSIPTTNGVPADLVIGQPNLDTADNGTSQRQLRDGLEGMMVDKYGRVIVTEYSNNRIMIWNTIPTTNYAPADMVVGQPDFTTTSPAYNGCLSPTRSSFCGPEDAYSDGTRLYVADDGNKRVLIWKTIPTTLGTPADFVVGQPSFFTKLSGVSANKLASASAVTADDTNMYIFDRDNRRVVISHLGLDAPIVSGPISVGKGLEATISWNMPANNNFGIDKFSLYVDNQLVQDNIHAKSAQIITTGLSGGVHSYYVEALNYVGKTAQSGEKTFNIGSSISESNNNGDNDHKTGNHKKKKKKKVAAVVALVRVRYKPVSVATPQKTEPEKAKDLPAVNTNKNSGNTIQEQPEKAQPVSTNIVNDNKTTNGGVVWSWVAGAGHAVTSAVGGFFGAIASFFKSFFK